MSGGGAMIEFFVGIWATIGVAAYGLQKLHRWRWRRLVAAMNDGDLERAESLWQQLIAKLTPPQRRSANVLYFEAGLLALREDWQAALAIFDLLRRSKHGTQAVMVMRARCLAELDRADDAMKAAEEALAAPGLTSALRASVLIAVGIVQLRRGEYARALATLEQPVALSQMKAIRASCSFYRGDALRALGQEQEAIQAYEHVAAIVPLSRRAAHARQRLTQAPPSGYR
jgi:tetratricopeptide (TPR) repeat protein